MKSGKIPNSAITATSSYSDSYLPQYARLDNTLPSNVHAAWFPKSHDDGQFIQVDLGEITKITRIATQGRYKVGHYTKNYYVTYSVEGGPYLAYKENQVNCLIRTYFKSYVVQVHYQQWKQGKVLLLTKISWTS